MYDKLAEFIAQGEYQEALYEFQEEYFHIEERTPSEAARLCILEASIWEALSDGTAEFDAISKGLSYDNTNYELYYMLGLYYQHINVNKAYLCMEQALLYCDAQEDREVIESSFNEIKERPGVSVRGVSVMILSYNDLELMKMCIDSIEETFPMNSFEIVVVDNASTEKGVIDYLRDKEKGAEYCFKLIENSENLGFPAGCNIGAENCNPENDIFFLNNDACMTPGAIFWLRMGLYEKRNVGATGPLSNSASLQEIDGHYFLDLLPDAAKDEENPGRWHKKMNPEMAFEIFKTYSNNRSTLLRNPYIKAFRLTGFALLLSHEAKKAVAVGEQVFDELFSPGYFEDDDLGIRLATAGFEQYICQNSFVYHNGGGGFEGHNDAMEASREKFREKWGFDIWDYSMPWEQACEQVLELAKEKKGLLRVLDFTCGFGANASYIKSRRKDVYIAGVCSSAFAAGIAGLIVDDVTFGELNTVRIPWEDRSFDVVIAEREFVSRGQVSHCLRPGGVWIGDDKCDIINR